MKALALLERLNREPYSLSIQLEDLNTEGSLNQVCDAVLSTIATKSTTHGQTPTSAALGNLTEDDAITLLSALGFKGLNDAEKQESFRRGDRPIVLSALEYLAEQPAELLQKRCYLAQFLLPCVIPGGLSREANAEALLKRYQQNQAQFKNVHRQYSALQKEVTSFAQLSEEIEQLETERTQLTHRIDDLKNQAKNRSNPESFELISRATSEMRLFQEEEIQQQQQLEETAKRFEAVNRNYTDTKERLAVLERCMLSPSGEESPTIDSILQYLAKNVQEYSTNTRSELALSQYRARERLNGLSSDSHVTNDDVLALKLQVDELEKECKKKKTAIERARDGSGGDVSGVGIFITYNNEAAMTLEAREDALETKRKELLCIEEVLKDLETEVMANQRLTATKTEKLSLIRPTNHDHACDADKATSNELKERRAELLDLEDEHKTKRERYERLSLRFAADRQILEDDVDRLEKEWVGIDKNQKELQQSNETTEVALKQLDDFATAAEKFQEEIANQKGKLHQLHQLKHEIEGQYSYGSKQRSLFSRVEKLLHDRRRELDLAPRVVGF